MKKILVVDDEPTVRESIMMSLDGRQFEVIEADNCTKALDMAKVQKPDLILTDIVMDNGNGFLLKELLKQDEMTAQIPVILMTGHAKSAGAWGSDPDATYLEKPFSAGELLRLIRDLLKFSSGEAR